MCEHCLGFTRRQWLKASALAATAALVGCESQPVVSDLPMAYEDHLVGAGGPVPIDRRKIIVPPPIPAQRTEYGDIMTRAAWTRSPLQLVDGTPMNGVHRITIHHSGEGKPFLGATVADVAQHLQIVREAHLQRGMIDIAYHFAVDRVGRVWQLRWLAYEGQHVRDGRDGTRWNAHNAGVVALGDFNVQSPTVAQRDRLLALVRLLRAKYALPISMVRMHGELVQTDCPGRRLSPYILDARRRGQL